MKRFSALFFYGLYSVMLWALWPAIWILFVKRWKQGKETEESLKHRQGISSEKRPEGPLFWAHGASVGEIRALAPLLKNLQIQFPDVNFLVTTTTLTGKETLMKLIPQGITHQFLPLDYRPYVKRFLKHWKPDFILWTESDFWPTLFHCIHTAKIPHLLVNGRLSVGTYQKWKYAKPLFQKMVQNFSEIYLQSPQDQSFYATLAPDVETKLAGNLKFYRESQKVAQSESLSINSPSWAAVSVHRGEEEALFTAHASLRNHFPEATLILAPRHPQNSDHWQEQAEKRGFHVLRHSTLKSDSSIGTCDVYLVDTLGELAKVYPAALVTFVGGSFIDRGGHNMIEPAIYGSLPCYGPSAYNFSHIHALFEDAGLSLQCTSESLATFIRAFFENPEAVQPLLKKLYDIMDAEEKGFYRIQEAVIPYIKAIRKLKNDKNA